MNEGIDYLRTIVGTRNLPQRLIKEIGLFFEINFVISFVDERTRKGGKLRNRDIQKLKCFENVERTRIVKLLFKKHHVFGTPCPITVYYLRNMKS